MAGEAQGATPAAPADSAPASGQVDASLFGAWQRARRMVESQQQQLEQAQAIAAFVLAEIAAAHGLVDGDVVHDDGTFTRAARE